MNFVRRLTCAVLIPALSSVAPMGMAEVKASVDARPIPPDIGAAATWQALKRLHTRASVLMIVAHPDDEDGATLAYESRGVGATVSLLTLDRGEGGANVMSSDYWDALGLVRTEELLQAGRYYGLDAQYFTSMADYGFSKALAEALSQWGARARAGAGGTRGAHGKTADRLLGFCGRADRRPRPACNGGIDGARGLQGCGRSEDVS